MGSLRVAASTRPTPRGKTDAATVGQQLGLQDDLPSVIVTTNRMDLGDQSTWSERCLAFVDSIVDELDQSSNTWRSQSPNDIGRELGHIDRQFEIEDVLRSETLADSRVLLAHFTRLLPEQVEAITRDGLTPLTVRLFEERTRAAGERHGISAEQIEEIIRRSPVHDGDGFREGQLWGVAPLQPAADQSGDGLTCFLDAYGGESTYWDSSGSPAHQRLTELSAPVIVHFLADPQFLNGTQLWKVLVAQRSGRVDAWHEWFSARPIEPHCIYEIIGADHRLWPYD